MHLRIVADTNLTNEKSFVCAKQLFLDQPLACNALTSMCVCRVRRVMIPMLHWHKRKYRPSLTGLMHRQMPMHVSYMVNVLYM